MKLNGKGLKKIERWQEAKRLGHPYPVNEIEFEHDDFDGFITLTVNMPRGVYLTDDEAKSLIEFFKTMKPEMPNGGCMEYCDLWTDLLSQRTNLSK